MDGQTLGMVGGIAGGVIGVLGGLLGTYAGIKNTGGPSERAYTIRATALCWLMISAFLACLFLLPMPWRALPWLAFGPCLVFFVRRGNAGQARARAEDLGESP